VRIYGFYIQQTYTIANCYKVGNQKTIEKTGRNRKALRVGKIKLKNKIMPTIVIRHKVRDIKAWLNGHNDRVKIFAPAISGFKTFQDTDDPKSVVLVVEVTDMEKLAEIMKDTKVMEDIAKAKHTVLEPIIMSMPVAL
jgi:hypothetical protein